MDDRYFFNPYIFPGPFMPPNMSLPPNIAASASAQTESSPKDFYENQYYYYRYLNEFMDYQLKAREYERSFNKPNTNNKNI